MKKIKKHVSIFLTVILLFNICIFANAQEDIQNNSQKTIVSESKVNEIKEDFLLTSKNEKIEYLKAIFCELNVPTDIVDYISDEKIERFINAEEFTAIVEANNKNNDISVADNFGGDTDTDESMDELIIWAREIVTGSDGKDDYYYTLLATFTWTTAPLWRLKDTVSVSMGEGSIVNGTQEAIMQYKYDGVQQTETFDKDDNEYKGVASDCTFLINLPNSLTKVSDLAFAVSYEIRGESDAVTVCGQYFHKIGACVTSISLSGEGLGISVSPSTLHRPYSIQCGVDPID